MSAVDNEKFYDEEIAPTLLDLAKKCQHKGLSFVASVQFGPGDPDRGDTLVLTKDANLSMIMLRLLAHSAPNIDAFMINLTRYCRDKGIDTSASMYMNMAGAK